MQNKVPWERVILVLFCVQCFQVVSLARMPLASPKIFKRLQGDFSSVAQRHLENDTSTVIFELRLVSETPGSHKLLSEKLTAFGVGGDLKDARFQAKACFHLATLGLSCDTWASLVAAHGLSCSTACGILEKTLMLWKIEGRRKRGRQRMRGLDGITYSMDMSLSKLSGDIERQGTLVCCNPWVGKKSDMTERLNNNVESYSTSDWKQAPPFHWKMDY